MTAVEMITSELDNVSVRDPAIRTQSVIVATDGSDAAIAAFGAASRIAESASVEIHVLTVIEPMPVMFPAVEGMMMSPELEKSREDAQRMIVADQIKIFDPDRKWTLNVTVGRPAEAIVAFARSQQAALIIIGDNKHGLAGRIFGEETATEIARLSDIPLLVASPANRRRPRRILMAMALHRGGMKAVGDSLSLLGEKPMSISCVHVKPRSEFLGIDWAELDEEYEFVMRERFGEIERMLQSRNLRSELVVLHGDTAKEISDFAAYCKAELIVVGVRRRAGRSRAIGGRMAARVLRNAQCSVLVLPDSIEKPKLVQPSAGTTDVIQDPIMWSDALRGFTSRNAGRIVNLEVDDLDAGSLMEATAYPLIGADYDRKSGRLTISLGSTHGVERHLTRSITHPEKVAVLSVNGRDTALSVTHGGGQTLVTF
ncbi:MAG TPA: universal stress protein [Gemmatimonadaceae bacterium]